MLTKDDKKAGSSSSESRLKNIDFSPRKRDVLVAPSDSNLPEVISDEDKDWNDIVFERRNRKYGAYVLRKGYNNSLITALLISTAFFLLVLFAPAIAKVFSKNDKGEILKSKKLVYTDLSAPPPIDKPKPPPPQFQLPKLQKVIKFVPPKVVKEQIIEEVPTIEEIKQNETAATEVDGATDVVFEEPVADVAEPDEDEVFVVVEQEPEFPGGYNAMMAFVQKNMTYPANARRMQVDGTVYVSFVVGKDGTISEVKVLRGIMKECDAEALRVIGLMPKWKPGKQNGRNVNVRYTLPLKFRLN
jgi:protein TonB